VSATGGPDSGISGLGDRTNTNGEQRQMELCKNAWNKKSQIPKNRTWLRRRVMKSHLDAYSTVLPVRQA